jgi:hypothetical protein
MSPREQLEQLVTTTSNTPDTIAQRLKLIEQFVFDQSPFLITPNFESFCHDDLSLLFLAYDQFYFEKLCRETLGSVPLNFRWSNRMTNRGGKTSLSTDRRTGMSQRYEIAVSVPLLFGAFHTPAETVRVSGHECRTRFEALQKIFEHELIHLIEFLLWQRSSCASSPFQSIASRLFGHTDHRHEMFTPRERARQEHGIRPGMLVRFRFDDRELMGRINRITKRATILVESSSGLRYSDGKRYEKYYVPVKLLERVED